MKILVLDNYDSFVYNLVHALEELSDAEITVAKNDEIELEEVRFFDKILLSPGPGLPEQAGIMPQLLQKYVSSKSILGVCLGHQAIAQNFKAALFNLEEPLHGVATTMQIVEEDYLFDRLPKQIEIGHYHSWVTRFENNDQLKVLAYDQAGNIMALKHREYDVRGVQFHPESILTPSGKEILRNWVLHKV